jgi:hypothetical protein
MISLLMTERHLSGTDERRDMDGEILTPPLASISLKGKRKKIKIKNQKKQKRNSKH